MKRYEVSCDDGEAFEMENGRFYLASDVDARIAELEKAFAAALRWLPRDIAGDVQAKELPKGDYNGEYMNDLADMRAARSL